MIQGSLIQHSCAPVGCARWGDKGPQGWFASLYTEGIFLQALKGLFFSFSGFSILP